MRRLMLSLLVCLWCTPALARQAAPASVALETLYGTTVSVVRVVSQGAEVRDPQVASLITILPGRPLEPASIRGTIVRLMGLGTYFDVRVHGDAGADGVHVEIELVPLKEIARLVFRGESGVSERALQDAVALRYGSQPPVGRASDMARTVEDVLRDYGYLRARVLARPLDTPTERPGDLVFDIEQGPRARISEVEVRGGPEPAVARVRAGLDVTIGDGYHPAELRRQLDRFVTAFRRDGYLEARVDPFARVSETQDQVALSIVVTRGPRVRVTFAGDPLPAHDRGDLVPVAREGSADQDLLEDSQVRIERYLQAQGYRDARAPFTRTERGEDVTIVFAVTRGPMYRVSGVAIQTDAGANQPQEAELIRLAPGQPFVQSQLARDAGVVLENLRRRGYSRATVTPLVTVGTRTPGAPDVPVSVAFSIDEGPRAVVSEVRFDGNALVSHQGLRSRLATQVGRPYYRPLVQADADLVLTEYRNRGYRDARIDPLVTLTRDGTGAQVVFAVSEGPQILVDRILIVGNRRISEATIRREVTLRTGAALGDAAVAESQRRLAALGLFRRSTISELPQTGTNRRDVLVTVEEAPTNTLGYGGGFELQKVESTQFAPSGFLELGRRNLWGKNRSVNLFSRLSLRHLGTDSAGTDTGGAETNAEYRVIGSYREPRFLGTRGDLQVAAVAEQSSRTSFRYRHQSARVDFVERRANGWSYLGQFMVERNEIFDDRIDPTDRPLIDRVFPQVRLSSLGGTVANDTRNDPLDPDRGSLVSVNGEVALRQIGSQVGYAKGYAQGFVYRRVPGLSRLVLAGGVRVGLGTGFSRTVEVTGADGNVTLMRVRDLPASERFFAGGDTSVRGFELDRLGSTNVFDRDGTPIGGHAQLILNTEARLTVWKDVGVVGFLDVGNVYPTVNDIDLDSLRSGAGFGFRYKSPIGPLRMDFGFKLGTLRTFGPKKERRFALHINIGQAF